MTAKLGYVHADFFPKLTLDQVEEQIAVRNSLLQQMVGSLYPSIVNDELAVLYRLRAELKKPKPKKEVWTWP